MDVFQANAANSCLIWIHVVWFKSVPHREECKQSLMNHDMRDQTQKNQRKCEKLKEIDQINLFTVEKASKGLFMN